MPFPSSAPSNKRKANKIITDLSKVSQNGENKQIRSQSVELHIYTRTLTPI